MRTAQADSGGYDRSRPATACRARLLRMNTRNVRFQLGESEARRSATQAALMPSARLLGRQDRQVSLVNVCTLDRTDAFRPLPEPTPVAFLGLLVLYPTLTCGTR